MRIISGKYRSSVLSEFKGDDIRPTADRVKESLFNIISPHVAGARVLDLFCGSGGLGLECISRASGEVVFNDISRNSLAVLQKNLQKLRLQSGYKIYCLNFAECLASLCGSFDIIFLDPPYRLEVGAEALQIISRRNLLSTGGIAVYEWDRPFTQDIEGLKLYNSRKYGITYLHFFEVSQ